MHTQTTSFLRLPRPPPLLGGPTVPTAYRTACRAQHCSRRGPAENITMRAQL